MPELPEVETMVRGIRPLVEGRQLLSFRRCPCSCRPLTVSPSLRTISSRLRGQTVAAVRRRGKRIVMEFDSGLILAIEPRMTGLMLAADPPDTAHLRLEWTFSEPVDTSPRQPGDDDPRKTSTIWFWDRRGLGTVALYTREEYEAVVESGRLGPDALELTAAAWATRLNRTSRSVKVALLDQKLVAGIGNLYASEILHLAAIAPSRPASSLTKQETARLARSVRRVLEQAIRDEGSTLSDATYRTVLSEPGRYQNRHRVYARAGEPCPRCGPGSEVQRIVQQQRSTFYCPDCQRPPR
ncbi:MAG: bifunctional DNA-formamidopyrimidine glycosylase/DNA-(apurinic or apyrimidinic site) lyase [Planctomycetaceae bacterium]|nr:bifunctional DNA-formamidopyrimidine glycosylase/DNA-(apurinic or apyrimidinic site) lyase [Planctomycetaceae bacterium]